MGTGQELIVEDVTKPDLLFKSITKANLWFTIIKFTPCSTIDLTKENLSIKTVIDNQIIVLTELEFIKEERQYHWHTTLLGSQKWSSVDCLTGKVGNVYYKV